MFEGRAFGTLHSVYSNNALTNSTLPTSRKFPRCIIFGEAFLMNLSPFPFCVHTCSNANYQLPRMNPLLQGIERVARCLPSHFKGVQGSHSRNFEPTIRIVRRARVIMQCIRHDFRDGLGGRGYTEYACDLGCSTVAWFDGRDDAGSTMMLHSSRHFVFLWACLTTPPS